ncbi:MAG: hypothetical protein BTN85_2005 [Candidatus Methanohalarchaeum thermophilum]|uniref:Uncharacterized protein n=1 Tax=Methanohalarchaeum thermophilum TaxID=1903181 RepID=A0A1Q6DSK7_METT1|nr:MAG: hypothetical protein BTN85_2005 [Candidatus Methanohalarchaeum thermophilum]
MQLREWVKNKFGGTGNTLLDESVYGQRELREDISVLEQSLKKVEKDMEKCHRKYVNLLKEGSEKSELKRKTYATKANYAKKKYAVKRKKYKANSVKLGTLYSIKGMREVIDMQDSQDLHFDEIMKETPDAQEMQNKIKMKMAQLDLEMEDLKQIEDAIDLPIMESEDEQEITEEEKMMEEIRSGKKSPDEIEIETEEGEQEPVDELDMGPEI